MENNTVIDIRLVSPTKTEIKRMAQDIATEVNDGLIPPIELLVKMEATKAMCDEVRALIQPTVLAELSRNKEPLTYGMAKVEAAEVGFKYDYSSNAEWVSIKKQEDELAAKRKVIEERMKKIPYGSVLVDEDTGETWKGAIKTSTISFKVTLGK